MTAVRTEKLRVLRAARRGVLLEPCFSANQDALFTKHDRLCKRRDALLALAARRKAKGRA